jgi:hypothetical protein
MLPVVAPLDAPHKLDHHSLIQVYERRGSGGLPSRPSVYARRRGGEDVSGSASFSRKVTSYGVPIMVRIRVYMVQVGKVVGCIATSKSTQPTIQKNLNELITRPLMTHELIHGQFPEQKKYKQHAWV